MFFLESRQEQIVPLLPDTSGLFKQSVSALRRNFNLLTSSTALTASPCPLHLVLLFAHQQDALPGAYTQHAQVYLLCPLHAISLSES